MNKIFLLIITMLIAAVFGYSLISNQKVEDQRAEVSAINTLNNNMPDKEELKIEVVSDGSGQEAVAGNIVAVHYTGILEDGTKFDSSLDRGQPFAFQLGEGMVIQGWEQGILGMKVGEKRRLIIPPSLGYGQSGIGPIPPNATLIFEVELLGIQ